MGHAPQTRHQPPAPPTHARRSRANTRRHLLTRISVTTGRPPRPRQSRRHHRNTTSSCTTA